jgi:hypothetical protein
MAPIKVSKPSRSKASKALRPAKTTRPNVLKKSVKVPERMFRSEKPRSLESAPVSISNLQVFDGPRQEGNHVMNSELINGSISGSTTYTVQSKYNLNPGLAASFPWLSTIASKYQFYRFKALRFRYITRQSSAKAGSLMLSPDYNVTDAAPITELEAMNTYDAAEDVCWKEISCILSPKRMFAVAEWKLIRDRNISGEKNLYDAANLYVCTSDCADTTVLGKLWVDYIVEFSTPQNSFLSTSSPRITSLWAMANDQTFISTLDTIVKFDTTVYDPINFGAVNSAGSWEPGLATNGCYLIHVNLVVNNNTSETTFWEASAKINGTAASSYGWTLDTYGAGATGSVSLGFTGIIPIKTGDQFAIYLKATGAAGTLKLFKNYCSLIIQMA